MAIGRGNIVQRIVRLIFDRSAAQKAESDTKRSVSGMDKALAGLKKTALAVGAAFASAFALTKVIGGLKSAITASIEADKIWNRLAGTLETRVGIAFGSVESQIRAAARAMQDTTTVGDEEFAQTLQTLISLSGDYEESLRNVNLVADTAAGLQVDLSTAADLIGRAMTGNTQTLSRYIGKVEEGVDVLEMLRTSFRGMAQVEARSLGGQIQQLSNEWGDFKEALGDALIDASNGPSIIDRLTESLRGLTNWMEENGPRLKEFWQDFLDRINASREGLLRLQRLWLLQKIPSALLAGEFDLAKDLRQQLRDINAEIRELEGMAGRIRLPAETDIAADIMRLEAGAAAAQERARARAAAEAAANLEESLKAAAELEKARQKELQLLLAGAEMRQLTADEQARLLEIERMLRAELSAGIPDLEHRLQIAKDLAAVTEATAGMRPPVFMAPRARRSAEDPTVQSALPFVRLSDAEMEAYNERLMLQEQWAQSLLDDLAAQEQAALRTASIMTDAFSTFFETLITDADNAGGALVAAMLRGLAQYFELRATAAFAEGLLGNPAGFAAGIAFSAAAGAARALSASLGRSDGGGRATASSGGAGLPSARSQLTQPTPDITLVLQGDFDALNPKFVRAIHTATNEGIETIGPGRVRLQTVSR